MIAAETSLKIWNNVARLTCDETLLAVAVNGNQLPACLDASRLGSSVGRDVTIKTVARFV
jgi:hypothetical protein